MKTLPIKNKLRILFSISLNMFSFFLFLPIIFFMVPVCWIFGFFKPSPSVLFTGLEHVVDKTARRGEQFERNGYCPIYYSKELTGNRTNNYPVKIIYSSHILTFDIVRYALIIIRIRPVYIEVYYNGKAGSGICQLFYIVFGLISKRIVNIILRGELYYYNELPFIYRKMIKAGCKICTSINYRELYMEDILKSFKTDPQKIFFDYNKVPVYPLPEHNSNRENIVLFLNSFKKWRRVDLVIKAVPYVLKSVPDAVFLIVGYRNENELNSVKDLLTPDIRNSVIISPWSNNPRSFYMKSKIYVLPADLIYCNFSLLEAMERGLPPIVSDVKDSDKIIKHGMNGFLSEQSSEKIAHHIITLLKNEDLRIRMGNEARQTIIKEFNDKDRIMPILKMIKKLNSSSKRNNS